MACVCAVLGAVVGGCEGGCRVGADDVVGACADAEVCGAVDAVVCGAEPGALVVERVAVGVGAVCCVAVARVAGAVLVAGCAALVEAELFPGIACAYPLASTTAPAAEATVIRPVVVRTRRSPRSRASARAGMSCVFLGDKVGLPRGLFRVVGPDAGSSLANGVFGIYVPSVQIQLGFGALSRPLPVPEGTGRAAHRLRAGRWPALSPAHAASVCGRAVTRESVCRFAPSVTVAAWP